MFRNDRAWMFVLLSILFIGCYATIAQILLIREFLVVFFGNELCLGIILGVWLFGVAFGAGVGGRVACKIKGHLTAFVLILLLMCAALPVELILIRVLRYIIDVPAGQYIPILSLLYSSIFLIVPFSFTIGLVFPVACKVVQGVTQDPASDIGMVFFLEAIGSLIGGIVFTFVLVSRYQPFTIIMVFNCVLFFNLLLMFLFHDKWSLKTARTLPSGTSGRARLFPHGLSVRTVWCGGKITICLLFLTVTFLLLITGIVNKIDGFFVNTRWYSTNPDIKLLESVDSRYENIVVGVRNGQYSVYGNGQYNFAFPNDYEYSQIAHLVMTQHPNPKKVLLIGGGMGGIIKEMLKHSVDKIHYIELDPALIELTKKYLPPDEINALSDKRVKVFHADGRYFVKKAKEDVEYDLIFANIPGPSTASFNRYYTLQFFQEVSHILKKNGVFAIGISSAVNYLGEEVGNYTGSIYRTLQDVFSQVIVSPGQTNYYFASDQPDTITFDVETLMDRYAGRNIKTEYFSEYVFHTLLPPERVKFIKDELEGRKRLKINTDSKPVTYFFNLILWDSFSGGQLHNILQMLEKTRLSVFIIPIFLFLLCRILYIIAFKRTREIQQKFNSIAAIATTGFAGMALEIILIFAFQNIYGYVYEKIGLIIALFMFGLAVGGVFSNKVITKSALKNSVDRASEKEEIKWIKILIFIEAVIVVYAGIIPFVLNRLSFQFFGSEYIFMFLVVVTGLLAGLEFPISSKLYLLCKSDPGVTAGRIDSADHAGAFVGAMLTGILFIPIFGIVGACVVIAALNLVSLLLLIFLFAQKRGIRNVITG